MIASQVVLDDLVTISGGGTPSKKKPEYFNGTIPWVSPKDMKSWEITTSIDRITEEAVENSSVKLIDTDAVLLVIRSGVLKHSLPVGINRVPITVNQDMKALRCGDRILPEYLARYLQANARSILTKVRGTTADNIPTDSLRQLKIPLPPLSEQKRIAEILDRADALRSQRRAALALLDELTQSIFLDMFGDPVRNPMGWENTKTLAEVASVGSGITKGRRTKDPVRAIPYMAVVNVQDKSLNLSVVKTINATDKEIDRYRLKRNDLLLTEGGDADKLGRGTLWNDELPECIHQNHIFRVRLETRDVTPLFLNWLVGGPRGKSYFLRQAKQTTGIATINMTQLKAFPMLIPPLKLQNDFAKRIVRIEDMRSSQVRSLDELDQLFASLQQRAFRGEL
ncbi:MAG: restriction endonuclease subunit S [Novipirellula sp. JB048]